MDKVHFYVFSANYSNDALKTRARKLEKRSIRRSITSRLSTLSEQQESAHAELLSTTGEHSDTSHGVPLARIPTMNSDLLSDEQVLFLVGSTDIELFRAGIEVGERAGRVPLLVMQRLGVAEFVAIGQGKPVLLGRVEAAFNSIYRKQDLASGGHIGVFMYHDIFARISAPIVFGQVRINPFDHVELTPVQKRIIQSEPEEMRIFIDQFCDVADVQYGSAELSPQFSNMELTRRFLELARLHLHAAAAILTGGYDPRGAVQSALLATELSLKSGAAAQNLEEEAIRDRFGHKVDDLAKFIGTAWPAFDVHRVRRVISRQPKYVQNRYSADQPSRVEVGHTTMAAQFVVAEVVRQMSDRNLRADLESAVPRKYPA